MARLDRIVSHTGRVSVITVSGLAGSGKSAAAGAIARRFGLRLVTVGNIFRQLAAEKETSLEDYLSGNPIGVHLKADRATYSFAKRGRCVLVGRLTGLVAGPVAYKIFLTAPIEVRAGRVAGRDGISYSTALQRIKLRDKTDKVTYKRIYGIDVDDLSHYNLVFDTQFFSKGVTAKLLTIVAGEAIKNWQKATTTG